MINLDPITSVHSLQLKNLLFQLGYNVSKNELDAQIRILENSTNDLMIGAFRNNQLIGWIHMTIMRRLTSPTFAEIVGLVVDESHRKEGIGKMLVDNVINWSKINGYQKVRVRCNSKRIESHLFYERLGFEDKKGQKVFIKSN